MEKGESFDYRIAEDAKVLLAHRARAGKKRDVQRVWLACRKTLRVTSLKSRLLAKLWPLLLSLAMFLREIRENVDSSN